MELRSRRGKGRDRTRETSHPDPASGPRRCPLLIATCNHSGRIYAGQLEADSLNNANSYQHDTNIPDDHPGEATPFGIESCGQLGCIEYSFVHSLYRNTVSIAIHSVYASQLYIPQFASSNTDAP